MRARTLILFAIAVILAGGTAILVRSFLAQRTAEAEATPLARVPAAQRSVLVARGAIARGQILKPQDFSWQAWPDGGIDRAYIQSGTRTADSLAGWVARDPFGPGEPITEAKIVAPGSRGFSPRYSAQACAPSPCLSRRPQVSPGLSFPAIEWTS
jgi:pilus assembly protein CpaB